VKLDANGDTIYTASYAERIAMGKEAHNALKQYDTAKKAGNKEAMQVANIELQKNFKYFGYGYFNSPEEAIPNVAITFYAFHIMVILGSYLLAFFALVLLLVYKKSLTKWIIDNKWVQIVAIITIPLAWICSQSGWVVAEVGRQPWVIEGLMPTTAAISHIPTSSVITTFFIFVVVFTGLLAAEINIMTKYISNKSKENK
jgi:cytochrome d ubiquinol oxidase subunit I